VTAMARDAVAFIRALGFDKVDLVGLSLGGFVAQVVALEEPQLVRKIVLAGTGPAGGEGIDHVTAITIREIIHGVLTLSDAKRYLFFTRTANGQRAARQFLDRLKERKDNRDAAISPFAFRAQLKAIHAWGRQKAADLSGVRQPVLVANGEHDRMVPTSNSRPRASVAEQRARPLPRRRTRCHLPVPRRVRRQSVGVSRAMSSVDVSDGRPVHVARRCGVRT
jgi:pimeloyl-ACP methyl ester carboxylesterase